MDDDVYMMDMNMVNFVSLNMVSSFFNMVSSLSLVCMSCHHTLYCMGRCTHCHEYSPSDVHSNCKMDEWEPRKKVAQCML